MFILRSRKADLILLTEAYCPHQRADNRLLFSCNESGLSTELDASVHFAHNPQQWSLYIFVFKRYALFVVAKRAACKILDLTELASHRSYEISGFVFFKEILAYGILRFENARAFRMRGQISLRGSIPDPFFQSRDIGFVDHNGQIQF
jgi:hypothetical protein